MALEKNMPIDTSLETGSVGVIDPAKELPSPNPGDTEPGVAPIPEIFAESIRSSMVEPPDQNASQSLRPGLIEDQEAMLDRNATRMVNEGGLPPGGEDGGGDEGGDREPDRGPEWEISPERGRWIVEQIVELRTTMSYEQRYSGENGRRLKTLYLTLNEYVSGISATRNNEDIWDPYIYGVDDDGNKIVTGIKSIEETPMVIDYEVTAEGERIPHFKKNTSSEKEVEPENLTGLLEIGQLAVIYDNDATPPEQVEDAERQLGVYLKEARRKGLLGEADNLLESAYEHVKMGDIQARNIVRSLVTQAKEAFSNSYKLRRKDPEVFRLAGLGDIYADWAMQRFTVALAGQEQPEYRGGEFRLNEVDEEGAETYWDVGHYPKYYEVTAKTPEQFLRAKESFLKMVRRGSLGKSPEEIYQHVDNFKEVFGQRGNQAADRGTVSHEFVIDQKLELEAQLFIFGADYSNETYNPESFKKFMTAMAHDEGPDRFIRLYRAGNGQVAAFSRMFDKGIIMEIFNNPDGERGELSIMAQHYFQDQIKQLVIEQGLGTVLKDYDPANHDPDILRVIDDPQAKSTRDKLFTKNLEQLGMAMSNEEFASLFDGFGSGNAHKTNYEHYMADRQLPPKERKIPDLSKLPEKLRKSIELGGIQLDIEAKRAQVQRGELVVSKGKTVLDLLSKEDRKIYNEAYEQAESNFDIAFQLQGATGEKVRRGGGFFYVDKNRFVRAYQRVQDDEDDELSIEERKKKWTNDQWLGWILNELADGRDVKSLSPEEQQLYKDLSDEDKENFAENMPVYIAEQFVQFAETMTKIQYRDDSEIWDDPRTWNDELATQIKNRNIERQEAENNELTKNKKEPKTINPLKDFKAQYRAEKTKVARVRAGNEIREKGFEAKHYNEDRTPMMLKRPRQNPDGSVYRDANGNTEVDEVAVDLDIARKHIYSRWTSHTYWAYQGENRSMLLDDKIFEAARRIRDGLSRAEDEDMLATQLLIVDPTLCRVRLLPEKQMQREITLLNAAVEESYQSHWRINRNLHILFLPSDGNPDKMRMGYNLEDWGGQSRFSMRTRDLVASQPRRFSRRMAALLADLPIEISSMADIWGQEGVSGAVSMFADNIKKVGHQGVAGQFAITKFIDQMDYGWQLFGRLVNGSVNERGEDEEGLYEKPTNNGDKMIEFRTSGFDIANFPEHESKMYYAYLESFGRLWGVLKLMRTTGSKVRNAQGALWMEQRDVFLPDGKYNPEIARDRNTGTSRHSEKIFYDSFIDWLTASGPGSGSEAYPDDASQFAWLNQTIIADDGKGKRVPRRIRDWLFDKMAR